MHAYVPALVDGEIALAPTGYVVELAGALGGPPLGGLQDERAFPAVSFQMRSALPLRFQCPSKCGKRQEEY